MKPHTSIIQFQQLSTFCQMCFISHPLFFLDHFKVNPRYCVLTPTNTSVSSLIEDYVLFIQPPLLHLAKLFSMSFRVYSNLSDCPLHKYPIAFGCCRVLSLFYTVAFPFNFSCYSFVRATRSFDQQSSSHSDFG